MQAMTHAAFAVGSALPFCDASNMGEHRFYSAVLWVDPELTVCPSYSFSLWRTFFVDCSIISDHALTISRLMQRW